MDLEPARPMQCRCAVRTDVPGQRETTRWLAALGGCGWALRRWRLANCRRKGTGEVATRVARQSVNACSVIVDSSTLDLLMLDAEYYCIHTWGGAHWITGPRTAAPPAPLLGQVCK